MAGQVPLALLVGAGREQGGGGVVDRDERQHQPRARRGRRARSRARPARRRTSRRPIPAASAGPRSRPARSSCEPRLAGTLTYSSSGTPVCACRQSGRDVRPAPVAHGGAELVKVAGRAAASTAASCSPACRWRPRRASSRSRCSADCMLTASAAKPACIGAAERPGQVHVDHPLGAAERLGRLRRQPVGEPARPRAAGPAVRWCGWRARARRRVAAGMRSPV